MSNMRERAKARRAAGIAARKSRVPAVDGVPLKVYLYWKKHTNEHRSRENWCHYWRVILLWSWLTWLRVTFARVFFNKLALMIIAPLLIAGVVYLSLNFDVVLLIVGVFIGIILIASYVVGCVSFSEYDRSVNRGVQRKTFHAHHPMMYGILWWFFAPGQFVSRIAGTFFETIFNIGDSIITWTTSRHTIVLKTKRVRLWAPLVLLIFSLLASFMIFMFIRGVMQGYFWNIVLSIVGFVTFLAVMLFTIVLFARISENRKEHFKALQNEQLVKDRLAEQEGARQALTPVIHMMFTLIYDGEGNDIVRSAWVNTYIKQVEDMHSPNVWNSWLVRNYMRGLPVVQLNASLENMTAANNQINRAFLTVSKNYRKARFESRDIVEPRKYPVKAFFAGIRDFVVLIYSVLLTTKWKTCPIVEIPNAD